MKKKFLALFLCLTVALAFAACGGGDAETEGEEQNGPTMAEQADTEVDKTKAPTKDNEAYGELSQEVKADWDKKYQYGNLSVGAVGDTLVNDFFDWTVHSVDTKKEINGTSAGKGYKFVVINMTMKNTEDFAYETGNFEFRGIAGAGDANEMDTMDAFYDGMIADQLELNPGESVTGDIVFKISEDLNSFIIDYEEFYGDGSVGNTYWFELKLK